jgi:glycosyltransferase involved in cell wall biosynthesis
METAARPLRLLMVTGIFPPDLGGPASYVPRMAAALTARGRQVKVICLSDRLDHDDSRHPFAVHRISRRLFLPFRLMATTLAIWRAARRSDLVFVNGLGSESALGALLAGRPAVHKVVGDYAWERATSMNLFPGTIDEYQRAEKNLKLRLFDSIRTIPQRLARQVIVPSQYLARIAAGWGIQREKIRVIYNAIAREPAASTAPPTLPPWPGRTLMTVCRLVRWKGVEPLIRLLPALPDTRLVVVGDGALRAELEALAVQCGVADRLHITGYVPPAEVHAFLTQADAFVLNSTYEGLPHVVLEAMAACVPVIATDVGGTSEVVTHDRTGLLIPPKDDAALRAAVERLWSDPALGARLTGAAAVDLADRFIFDAMLQATDDALVAALPRSGRGESHDSSSAVAGSRS